MFYQKGHNYELEIGEAISKAFNMKTFLAGFTYASGLS